MDVAGVRSVSGNVSRLIRGCGSYANSKQC